MPDAPAPTTEQQPQVHPANVHPAEPSFEPPAEAAPPAEAIPAAEGQPAAEAKPSEGAQVRSLQRREADLVRSQQSLKTEREQIARDRADIPRLIEEGVRKALGGFAEDPIAFAKQQGKDANFLADRILSGGKKTAEEIAREAVQRAEALEQRLADRDRQEGRAKAEGDFMSLVQKNDEAHPVLKDTWGDEEILRRGHMAADAIRAKAPGAQFSLQDIHDYLVEQAELEHTRRTERQTKRSGAQTSKPETADGKSGLETAQSQNGSGHQEKTTPGATASQTSTLRSTMGSERQSVPAKDILEMSPEDERAMVMRAAEQARNEVMAKLQNGTGRK
jgi:hypothetical protein